MPKGIYERTKEHKQRMSEVRKEKHYSLNTEFKKGQYISPKTEFKKGHIPWNKSKTEIFSKEALERISKGGKKRMREKHPMWKGGKIIDKSKERWFIYMPEHPFCNQNGYIRQSRLIMEKYLGRYLKPEEVVHHIDEDKLNDDIDNLELFSNKNEHIKRHWELKSFNCKAG